jgi:hypothetical protein
MSSFLSASAALDVKEMEGLARLLDEYSILTRGNLGRPEQRK